jgi:outer membrane lipoprotein SlyB
MELSRERPLDSRGLLYPLMVIAAIALIVFSLVGMATITGFMPSALAHSETETAQSDVTFECAECGVLESMRELERRDQSGGRGEILAALSR